MSHSLPESGPALFPVVRPLYDPPLVISHGQDCYLFDESGKRYLDAYAGVASVSVGHASPEVLSAVSRQMARVHHVSMLYLTRPLLDYMAALHPELPPGLSRFFFVNSGSEAVDLACQSVRAARPGRLVFAFTDGFHGGSFQAKSLTGLPAWQPIAGADADIRFLEFPRCSSCPQAAPFVHRRRLTFSGWQCDGSCFDPLEREIRDHCSVTAGIFLEPVLGVGGILPAARRFFDRLSQLCGQLRIPLVVDEVQTGFGRCGQSLFVSSRLGLVPDVICLAKGMANGIPMGLVVAVPEIAAAMKEKLHFSTFGGNPLSCAAALATLEVIRSRKLAENAHDVGEYLMDRLAAEIGEDERVVAIRGLGLLIGLEVTSNETAVGVLNECGRRGLLIGIGGRSRTVLRVEPPLTFTREMADDTVQTIASALRER